MIENDAQYELTRAAVERFEIALAGLLRETDRTDGVHPLLRKAQEDSIRSELEILQRQMRTYDRNRPTSRALRPAAQSVDRTSLAD